MKKWLTRSKKTLFSQPPWLVVEQHEVELPDGRVIPDWPWVITPDYINVLAVTEDGLFLCFNQVKYGLPNETLALVGGYITPGEDPLSAAQRELGEETGYQAENWFNLGQYLVDPNRGIATGHLFLATGARQAVQPVQDDLEEQELIFLNRETLENALSNGKIQVLAWAATVALGLRVIDQRADLETKNE